MPELLGSDSNHVPSDVLNHFRCCFKLCPSCQTHAAHLGHPQEVDLGARLCSLSMQRFKFPRP
eukprot:3514154-Amphidinium_carterae.1